MFYRVVPPLSLIGLSFALVAGCDDDGGSGTRYESAYVTSTLVFDSEGQTTYVAVIPSLDVDTVSLARAQEFPGWSGAWAHQGSLFVSDGESPTVTRFSIGLDGRFDRGPAINFLNYGIGIGDSAFVGPTTAYVFGDDAVVWNPETVTVTGEFALPVVEDRPDGLAYQSASTGRAFGVRGDRAFAATSWTDWARFRVDAESMIVVLDTTTHQVLHTIPVSCPYIDVVSVDDDGYVYFSNWVYTVPGTLEDGDAHACAVRIAPGADTLDPTWSVEFADVADGHEGAALRVLGNGKAIFSAFHQENVRVEDYADEPGSIANTANWEVWSLDLATLEAEPVPGIPLNAGGYASARVDGRTFVLVPSADYSSTAAYEILPDMTATLRWTIPGWSGTLFRLR